MPSWFFHIFFCSFCGHVDYGFDSPCGYFCQVSRTLSLSLEKTIRSWFFLKKSLYSNSFSDHVDCSFGNSVKCVLSVTPRILAQSPKVRKVLFLLEKCPSESSAGRLECLPDETGVLLQIEISSEGPRKHIKLFLLAKNFYSKSFTGHADFSFDTLVENICKRQELLYSESANRVKIKFFSNKNLLIQSVSLITWHAVLTSLPFLFHQKPETFSLRAQKFEKFWFI